MYGVVYLRFLFPNISIYLYELLRTAFATSHRFWHFSFLFLFFQHIFIFLLWLIVQEYVASFPTCLYIFQFSPFCIFLVLCYCGWKRYLVWISILTLLRLIMWPIIWSILENVLYILEKNMCSVAVRWNVLYMSVRSIWSKMQFMSNVSLLII